MEMMETGETEVVDIEIDQLFKKLTGVLANVQVSKYKHNLSEKKRKQLAELKEELGTKLEDVGEQHKDKLGEFENVNIEQFTKKGQFNSKSFDASFSSTFLRVEELRTEFKKLELERIHLDEKIKNGMVGGNSRKSSVEKRFEEEEARLEKLLSISLESLSKLNKEQEKVKSVWNNLDELNMQFYPLAEKIQEKSSSLLGENLELVEKLSRNALEKLQNHPPEEFAATGNVSDSNQTLPITPKQNQWSATALRRKLDEKEKDLLAFQQLEKSAAAALDQLNLMCQNSKSGKLQFLISEKEELLRVWQEEKRVMLETAEVKRRRMRNTLESMRAEVEDKRRELAELTGSLAVAQHIVSLLVTTALHIAERRRFTF